MTRSTTPTSAVLVTGGASGIGRASAEAVAAEGRPVALWDLNAEGAAEVANRIAAEHGVVTTALGIDVTRTAELAAAVAASRAVVGRFGGLVHAAGTVRAQSLGALDDDGWDSVVDVNLRAFPMLVQALLDDLTADDGGAVVGISSIEGWVGNAAIPAYCASKSGMLGVVRSMAAQLGPRGVRVNAICPGFIETAMLAPSLAIEGVADRFANSSMLARIGRPSEIGEPAAFLLSDRASFITGQSLIVDGGVLAQV